jgi:hypothetical protein
LQPTPLRAPFCTLLQRTHGRTLHFPSTYARNAILRVGPIWISRQFDDLPFHSFVIPLKTVHVVTAEMWPTFGQYTNTMQPGSILSENQQFLARFAHMEWRQYSALSHGAFEAFISIPGKVAVAGYYIDDFLTQEKQEEVASSYDSFMTLHLGRAATVLLCLVTELQAHCRFDGHNINERICGVWSALVPLFEAKELYDGRYFKLMQEKGIMRRTE